MKIARVEIPNFLSHLPVDKKLNVAIPYTVYLSTEGIPDYRVNDEFKRCLCMTQKLCGICGKKLGKYKWFVGGDKCKESHYFVDAPMHERCMNYAFQVCPFLLGRKDYTPVKSAADYKISEGELLIDGAVETKRPVNMHGFKCRTYQLVEDGNCLYSYVRNFTEIVLKHSMPSSN